MTTIAPGTKAAFAAEHDAPIPYMQRTRDYYQVLGFRPYRWGHFVGGPFTAVGPLRRGPVHTVARAAGPGTGGADHHGGAVPGERGRSRSGRGVQRRRQ